MKTPEWFYFAFNGNTWLWFHMLAGGIGAKVGQAIGFEDYFIMLVVLGAALLWEVMEKLIGDKKPVYKTRKRWFFDTLGDIVGAVAIAGLVIL